MKNKVKLNLPATMLIFIGLLIIAFAVVITFLGA